MAWIAFADQIVGDDGGLDMQPIRRVDGPRFAFHAAARYSYQQRAVRPDDGTRSGMDPSQLHETMMSNISTTMQPLRPQDVSRLRLRDHPHIDEPTVLSLVIESPGASMWYPETGEFLVVTPWRHRSDILVIHTSGALGAEHALVEAAIQAARSRATALLSVAMHERRPALHYERVGFSHLEDIITYEDRRPRERAREVPDDRLRFERVTSIDDAGMTALLGLDHAAFPWMWQNSAKEFRIYLTYPGVEVWMGIDPDGGSVVTYAGFTHYHNWSHLDRIAVHPDWQCQGYGQATLAFARTRMLQQGARHIALSTQGDNRVSRRLYEREGFTRTPDDDYSIYGVVFGPPPAVADTSVPGR